MGRVSLPRENQVHACIARHVLDMSRLSHIVEALPAALFNREVLSSCGSAKFRG